VRQICYKRKIEVHQVKMGTKRGETGGEGSTVLARGRCSGKPWGRLTAGGAGSIEGEPWFGRYIHLTISSTLRVNLRSGVFEGVVVVCLFR